MKKEFKQTSAIVKQILTDYPQTRNSDNLLYVKVVEKLNERALYKPFWDVMASMKELGLPCFETVRRSRQKIQAKYEHLRADETVQNFRADLQEDYKKELSSLW